MCAVVNNWQIYRRHKKLSIILFQQINRRKHLWNFNKSLLRTQKRSHKRERVNSHLYYNPFTLFFLNCAAHTNMVILIWNSTSVLLAQLQRQEIMSQRRPLVAAATPHRTASIEQMCVLLSFLGGNKKTHRSSTYRKFYAAFII